MKLCTHVPHTHVWRILVIEQIFDFQFLTDLHPLGSGESKKHKISMVSGFSLVSMSVCLLVCGDDIFGTNRRKNVVPVLK